MCGKGLGRGIILEKLGGAKFCCAGGGRNNSEFRIVNSERGELVASGQWLVASKADCGQDESQNGADPGNGE